MSESEAENNLTKYTIRKMNPSQKKTVQTIIDDKNDPITKALMQNIMGTLPTKKIHVKCILCNLEFSSQIILDAHLKGARHAKKLKATNILETLKTKNVNYSKEEGSSGLKCNPCNVILNSLQQLETHLSGNRHKNKVSSGEWSNKEIVTKTSLSTTPAVQKKLVESKLLSCQPCKKTFNSESQLNVHLASKKHTDKVNGVVSEKKKRYSPYYKTKAITTPLSASFVPSSDYKTSTESYYGNDTASPYSYQTSSSSMPYDTYMDYQTTQPSPYPSSQYSYY